MKKVFTFLLFAYSISMNAQIPNNGFESWTTVGAYEDPAGWGTMNFICAGPFYSATKSTDHYPISVGSYSLRLENDTSLTQMTGSYGMAMTDALNYPFTPAFPMVGHPTSLQGYFKYDSQANDSMFIEIYYFVNGLNVGSNQFTCAVTTPSWTAFNIPLNYVSADSASILLSAFWPTGPTDGPNGNSVLYVDNLSFDNLITSVEDHPTKNDLFSVYPNPASTFIQINIDPLSMNNELRMNIYNAVGEVEDSEIIQQNQQLINIDGLTNGVYMVEVRSKAGSEVRKLIIRK